MNRRPIQVLAAVGVAVATVLGVGWAPGGASNPTTASAATTGSAVSASRAALTGLVCRHALAPANRVISDTAVMHPVSGASTVAVNFRLGRRPVSGGSFVPVTGPGLGTWLSKSLAGSTSWRVIHSVKDLSAPAVYRFDVAFRWLNSSGNIIAHTTRVSRICFQPELRPNLQVRSISVHVDAVNSSDDVYRALIRDAGATGVRHFQVSLSQGTTVLQLRSVGPLAAHQKMTVRLVGPACSSSAPPVVTADPNHLVDVYTRAQAALTATCPAS